ncbi:MAG: tetraacyldisaccharide 4'-kinase [Pseudomonadota bacterium]
MMQAPRFWQNPPDQPGFFAHALAPLSWTYAKATAVRVAKPAGYRSKLPVICVGNLNAGGTGKTPTVLALAAHLKGKGFEPAVLSRGHGGTLTTATQVRPEHTAQEVGDEPRLIAESLPCFVGRDRGETARLAEATNASVLILDDGFQNQTLHKDLNLVIVNAKRGFGNGRVIPAGPLREPVNLGLARADAVVSIGPEIDQEAFSNTWPLPAACPRLMAEFEVLPTGMPWQNMPCIAFAGIGNPEQFFQTLKGLGTDIKRSVALGDHQPLTPALMTRLKEDARKKGAQLVTTEKDAVRLPRDMRATVLVVPVRLKFTAPNDLNAVLAPLGL